jgi:hypothetical protein
MNGQVKYFLENNGFIETEKNTFKNEKCIVKSSFDGYEVSFDECSCYSNDFSIYWLIGYLTYYNLIDKNYIK